MSQIFSCPICNKKYYSHIGLVFHKSEHDVYQPVKPKKSLLCFRKSCNKCKGSTYHSGRVQCGCECHGEIT